MELLLRGVNTLSVLHQRLRSVFFSTRLKLFGSEIVGERRFGFMNIIVLWNVTSCSLVDISEGPAIPIIRSHDCPNNLTAAGFSETSVPKFMASHVIFATENTPDHGLWLHS